VENAENIEVVLPDRRSFTAELVGRDPNTDLALLKIQGSGYHAVKFGDSDEVEVGEWVLAVGYPFSLNITVTAGIVSAKGRSIGIINQPSGDPYSGRESQRGNLGIESFIQTDAAINPGNSGGALVNTRGELIGINTAIASMTGSYAGYAFAIPVNLSRKILDDLKEFGAVKRGMLGVSFPAPAVEAQTLKQLGLDPGKVKGVFITGIQSGSAADKAGLKEGDIIEAIDGVPLNSSAEFSERIALHRPGEKVDLTYLRSGKQGRVSVTLQGDDAARSLADNSRSVKDIYERLGASFSPLTPALRERYELRSGVVVTEVRKGGFFHQLGVPRGTIIAYINGKTMNKPDDIEKALLEARNSRVQMLGIAPDGSRVAFNFSMGT
jgi:S1-C subfamily serine protease